MRSEVRYATDNPASIRSARKSSYAFGAGARPAIDRLIASLDDGPADEGVEQAWADEIKLRVDEVRSEKVKTLPGDEVLRRLAKEFPDEH
jgi:hypothetical protein